MKSCPLPTETEGRSAVGRTGGFDLREVSWIVVFTVMFLSPLSQDFYSCFYLFIFLEDNVMCLLHDTF